MNLIQNNPFQTPPEYEKLLWDLRGSFSRRINIQHRLVYEVYENTE
ncbi:MAG: Txe/YoeB family addiction module toxin, partial [Synergistaceae bacterium]|nr:Txe/YoeB family addiction module toxin [Synergistaceae bacterium]